MLLALRSEWFRERLHELEAALESAGGFDARLLWLDGNEARRSEARQEPAPAHGVSNFVDVALCSQRHGRVVLASPAAAPPTLLCCRR